MVDISAKCIKTDYVAVVGTSQDFGLLYSTLVHPKHLARAILNDLDGVEDVFSGGMMASGNPNSGYRVIEEGGAKMKRNRDYTNKMMFAAQGIKGLRMNSAGSDYKTLIYFTTGYSPEQRAAIETAGQRYASAGRVFPITTSAVLISILNEANFPDADCDRKILRMDIYTHGIQEDLDFGYQGNDPITDQQSFRYNEAEQLDAERYNPLGQRSKIYSWACRTTITVSGETGGLASVMAQSTEAIVYAYARRTDYSDTWNSGSISAEEAGFVEIESSESIVLWHPDGALGRVVEGSTPAENPGGQFVYDGQADEVAD